MLEARRRVSTHGEARAVGVDRMVLLEQLAVMDLMALGDALLLPEDDLTLATVLKSPLFGLTDDHLFILAHGRRGSLWQALSAQEGEPFVSAFRALRDLRSVYHTRVYIAKADSQGQERITAEVV